MAAAAVGRRLFPFMHAIVAHHAGDAQPVIVEHALPAFGLRRTVRFELPPLRQRRLIAKKRQRQQFARVAEAAETFDGNKAVDLVQQRP